MGLFDRGRRKPKHTNISYNYENLKTTTYLGRPVLFSFSASILILRRPEMIRIIFFFFLLLLLLLLLFFFFFFGFSYFCFLTVKENRELSPPTCASVSRFVYVTVFAPHVFQLAPEITLSRRGSRSPQRQFCGSGILT